MLQKIAVLGDSILRGVVLDERTGHYVRLKENCVQAAQARLGLAVDNFARFGMTSEKGLEAAERRLPREGGYDACLICFGGNDVDHCWRRVAEDPEGENPPNVPCQRYVENMARIVGLARSRRIEPVLVTLPPIDSQRYFRFFSRDIEQRENILRWLGGVETIYERHKTYSESLFSLAKQLDCRIIDVRKAFFGTGDYKRLLCGDGIHPNAKGHAVMGDAFVAYAQAIRA